MKSTLSIQHITIYYYFQKSLKWKMSEPERMVKRKESSQLPLPRHIMILTTAAIFFGNVAFVSRAKLM